MRKRKQDSEFNTPGGMLTRLKNKLLAIMRIDPTRFNLLVERYAIKLNGGKKDIKSQSERTNLMSSFNDNKLTIKRFFAFLMCLELKSVRITITVVTKDDEEFEVSEKAVFRNNSEELKGDDNEK